MKAVGMAALAAGLTAGATAAQDGLTEEQVRGFVEGMVEDARQIAEDGDWGAIPGWIEDTFAEGGRVAADGSLLMSDGPVMGYEIVADREDLIRFGSMMLTGPHGMGEAIRDFSLTSTVEEVTVLPTGEAVAIVRFGEWGVLEIPAPEGAEAPAPIGFHSVAFCDLRLTGEGGAVRIAVAACETTTTM